MVEGLLVGCHFIESCNCLYFGALEKSSNLIHHFHPVCFMYLLVFMPYSISRPSPEIFWALLTTFNLIFHLFRTLVHRILPRKVILVWLWLYLLVHFSISFISFNWYLLTLPIWAFQKNLQNGQDETETDQNGRRTQRSTARVSKVKNWKNKWEEKVKDWEFQQIYLWSKFQSRTTNSG
jgi:hypothetical protein